MTSSDKITSIKKPVDFKRRYDIDWLRILAVFLVFIFHCSRFFDVNDWHVKNSELDLGIDYKEG